MVFSRGERERAAAIRKWSQHAFSADLSDEVFYYAIFCGSLR